jgi:hypothetical protein
MEGDRRFPAGWAVVAPASPFSEAGAQIKGGQKNVEAFRPPRPFRQDRRRIADPLVPRRRPAIARLRLRHLDRPNPRLDRPNRIVPVPDNAPATVRQLESGMSGQKRRELGLNRLLHQTLRAGPENFGQRIVSFIGMTEGDNPILVHGVTLLQEVRAGLAPTPLRRSNHPVITHFPS